MNFSYAKSHGNYIDMYMFKEDSYDSLCCLPLLPSPLHVSPIHRNLGFTSGLGYISADVKPI